VREVLFALLITGGLFVAFSACLDVGYRIGARAPDNNRQGITVVEGGVFGMLGLLLAFSFGTGIAHLDSRRALVVQEANAISTAYLRVDLLPPAVQPEMRSLFARYVDARLSAYQNVTSREIAQERFDAATAIQDQIWSVAIRAWRAPHPPQLMQVIVPSFNDMFDIATTRRIGLLVHNPPLVVDLLIAVALLSCVLAGYALSSRGTRPLLHMIVFALILALIIYAVIDMDYPRSGLIRIDAADTALVHVRDAIHSQVH
jgi:hypothetical protein